MNERPRDPMFVWMARGFLITGVVTFALTAAAWVWTMQFERNAVRTTGTVVEVVVVGRNSSGGAGRAGRTSYPRVTFALIDGSQAEFTHSRVKQWPPAYEVGERVPVWYFAAKPAAARIINSWWSLYGILLIMVALGALFGVLGWWAIPAMERLARGGRTAAA